MSPPRPFTDYDNITRGFYAELTGVILPIDAHSCPLTVILDLVFCHTGAPRGTTITPGTPPLEPPFTGVPSILLRFFSGE